jgi:hypothetical protein
VSPRQVDSIRAGLGEAALQVLALAFTPRYVVLTLCFIMTIVFVTPIGGSMLSGWAIPLASARRCLAR